MQTSITLFEKNIEKIKLYNKSLFEALKSIDYLKNDIKLEKNENEQWNIMYNGLWVHNFDNPEKEAFDIINKIENAFPSTIHIFFGLGLGYILDEAFHKLSGNIIVFEPDLEILKTTFDVIDLSEILGSNRVKIISNTDDMYGYIFNFFKTNTEIKLTYSKFYFENFKTQFNNLVNETQRIYNLIKHNVEYARNNTFQFFNQTIRRAKEKIQLPSISVLENIFKNKPAIIISAGPSLHKNIEILRENRDKYIVFCVGTAFKTLIKNNIKPDFLNIIEHNCCIEQVIGIDCSNINFISESYLYEDFFNVNFKRHFLTLSSENISNRWFSDIIETDKDFKFETKGTVSYNALYSAKVMGCNPIILLGQDLAFINNELYSKNSPYSEFKCIYNDKNKKYEVIIENRQKFMEETLLCKGFDEEYCLNYINHKLKELNGSLTQVLSQNGEMIPTQTGYKMFIEYFEYFASKYKNKISLYNCSKGGAEIGGFKNIDLKEISKQFLKLDIDVDNTLNNVEYKTNKIELFKNKVEEDINSLKKLQSKLDEANKYYYRYKRDIKHSLGLTKSSLKDLKEVLIIIDNVHNVALREKLVIFATCVEYTSKFKDTLESLNTDTSYNSQLKIIDVLDELFKCILKRIEIILSVLLKY